MSDDFESDPEHVAPQDPARENSPTVGEAQMEQAEGGDCYWNDKRYSDGSSVCDSRIRYKCWSGKWVEVGQC